MNFYVFGGEIRGKSFAGLSKESLDFAFFIKFSSHNFNPPPTPPLEILEIFGPIIKPGGLNVWGWFNKATCTGIFEEEKIFKPQNS